MTLSNRTNRQVNQKFQDLGSLINFIYALDLPIPASWAQSSPLSTSRRGERLIGHNAAPLDLSLPLAIMHDVLARDRVSMARGRVSVARNEAVMSQRP